MHILHICNDFLGTKAHISLFTELDKLGIKQTIYVPLNPHTDPSSRNMCFKTAESRIIFSSRLANYHKIFYAVKIKRLVTDLEKSININDIDLIHAAILCNEGAVAYELQKKYHIPYISAVRNTDLNAYMRIFKWRMSYFRNIALHAEKIIFISSAYQTRLTNVLKANDIIKSKYLVINNGLADIYLDKIYSKRKTMHSPVKVLFTGAFVKNKNIHGLVEAIKRLNDNGYKIQLSAIGNNLSTYFGEKKYAAKITEYETKFPWFTTFPAQPKEQLIESIRDHDIFALVSFKETFGLSYLEALSQGLPIIYTFNEGFDGTYPNGYVGFGAYAKKNQSIAEAIEHVIRNYEKLQKHVREVNLNKFRWSSIAQTYCDLYERIITYNR